MKDRLEDVDPMPFGAHKNKPMADVPTSYKITDMSETYRRLTEELMSQREEILKAFIAKYGYEPDRAIQVMDGMKWYVRRMTDEEWERSRNLQFQI
jgi:hypothetical protein